MAGLIVALLLAAGAAQAGAPAMLRPVAAARPGACGACALHLAPPLLALQVSSPYGLRTDPVSKRRRFHHGIDYAAPAGTPIHAARDGTIEVIEGRPGFGFYVRLRHAGGVETGYGHLLRFMPGLRRGSVLRRGDVIGFVGATGRATGAHLHYEVIVGGRQVDPSGG
jgi:murein DD-endopeptidase MepM/ murein hydrolase activator NlpD